MIRQETPISEKKTLYCLHGVADIKGGYFKMISIAKALKLLSLENHIFIYIKDKHSVSRGKLISIKHLREKIDLKNNYVYKISTKFSLEDGDFLGFMFVVDSSVYNKFPFF